MIEESASRVDRNSALLARLLLVLVSVTGAAAHGENLSSEDVDAEKIFSVACTQCHGLRPIQLLRNGAEGWTPIVQEMILRGAQVSAAEEGAVIQYLARSYGPGSEQAMETGKAPPGAQFSFDGTTVETADIRLPPGEGMELVNSRCRVCHDLGRVVSVARGKESWQRIVDDMSGRGVPASADQINLMVEYLFANFGEQKTIRTIDRHHK